MQRWNSGEFLAGEGLQHLAEDLAMCVDHRLMAQVTNAIALIIAYSVDRFMAEKLACWQDCAGVVAA